MPAEVEIVSTGVERFYVTIDPSYVLVPADAIPWGVLLWVCAGILAGMYLMYRYMAVTRSIQDG